MRDIAHEESDAQAEDVEGVLADLGIDEERRSHIIEVWNKADLVAPGPPGGAEGAGGAAAGSSSRR